MIGVEEKGMSVIGVEGKSISVIVVEGQGPLIRAGTGT